MCNVRAKYVNSEEIAMHSILTLRADYYAPVSETLNLSARGTKEAESIADRYADSRGYGFWELKFNQYSPNTPRLVRNNTELRVDRDLSNERKRGFNYAG